MAISYTDAKNNTYYFSLSNNISVFPCAYRGYNASGAIFQPEARIFSEGMLTKLHGGGDEKNSDSYIIGNSNAVWNSSNNLEFAIHGYYFNLKYDKDFPKPLYACLNLSTDQSRMLPFVTKTDEDTAVDCKKDGWTDYAFTGLQFTNSATLAKTTIFLQLTDEDGNICYSNLKPEVKHGKYQNQTLVGVNYKTNESLFSVGNGTNITTSASNAFTVEKEKAYFDVPLSVNNTLTVGSEDVNYATTLNGELIATGNITLGTDNNTNIQLNGTLTSSSETTKFGAITTEEITEDLRNVIQFGTAYLINTTAKDKVELKLAITTDIDQANYVTIDQNANTNIDGTLTVAGITTLNNNVTLGSSANTVQINGPLTVGTAAVEATETTSAVPAVEYATTLNGTLDVTGVTTIENNLNVLTDVLTVTKTVDEDETTTTAVNINSTNTNITGNFTHTNGSFSHTGATGTATRIKDPTIVLTTDYSSDRNTNYSATLNLLGTEAHILSADTELAYFTSGFYTELSNGTSLILDAGTNKTDSDNNTVMDKPGTITIGNTVHTGTININFAEKNNGITIKDGTQDLATIKSDGTTFATAVTASNGLTVNGAELTANNGLTINGAALTANNGLTVNNAELIADKGLTVNNALLTANSGISLGTKQSITGDSNCYVEFGDEEREYTKISATTIKIADNNMETDAESVTISSGSIVCKRLGDSGTITSDNFKNTNNTFHVNNNGELTVTSLANIPTINSPIFSSADNVTASNIAATRKYIKLNNLLIMFGTVQNTAAAVLTSITVPLFRFNTIYEYDVTEHKICHSFSSGYNTEHSAILVHDDAKSNYKDAVLQIGLTSGGTYSAYGIKADYLVIFNFTNTTTFLDMNVGNY